MALDVHTHSFEHFELASISVDLVNLGFVLLEKSGHGQQILLCLGVAKILRIVCDCVEMQVVVLSVDTQAALDIVTIPLKVGLSAQVLCSVSDEVIFCSQVDLTVRVDVVLEFGLH